MVSECEGGVCRVVCACVCVCGAVCICGVCVWP